MLEFYRIPLTVISALQTVSALCITVQAFAMLAGLNRHMSTTARWAENVGEIFALLQTVLLSLILSRVATDMGNPIIAAPGYVALRYGVFAGLVVSSLIACVLRHRPLLLITLPCAMLTLPVMERPLGRAFPLVYILMLAFWTGRAVYICFQRQKELRHEISAFSIKEAMDALHTGLLYCKPGGEITLMNRRMQELMLALTGRVWHNGLEFRRELMHSGSLLEPEATALGGEKVFQLEDGTVWLFSDTELTIGRRTLLQVTAADVTERWTLTAKLKTQREDIQRRSEELSRALQSIEEIRATEELLRLQSKVHDMMAQRLAILMRIFRSEMSIAESELVSYADDMIVAVKEEMSDEANGLDILCKLYGDIGVRIVTEGEAPESAAHAEFYSAFVREGITNAVRHGLATEATVTCCYSEAEITISVINDGHLSDHGIVEGSGITELRRRAALLDGRLEIKTRPKFALTAYLKNFEDGRTMPR